MGRTDEEGVPRAQVWWGIGHGGGRHLLFFLTCQKKEQGKVEGNEGKASYSSFPWNVRQDHLVKKVDLGRLRNPGVCQTGRDGKQGGVDAQGRAAGLITMRYAPHFPLSSSAGALLTKVAVGYFRAVFSALTVGSVSLTESPVLLATTSCHFTFPSR